MDYWGLEDLGASSAEQRAAWDWVLDVPGVQDPQVVEGGLGDARRLLWRRSRLGETGFCRRPARLREAVPDGVEGRVGVQGGPGRPREAVSVASALGSGSPLASAGLWDYRWLREEAGIESLIPEGPGWVAERVASVLQGGCGEARTSRRAGWGLRSSGGPFGFFGFIGSSPGVDGIPTPMRFSNGATSSSSGQAITADGWIR